MKTAQNSNVRGGHKCLSQPSQVSICICIICICLICICPRQTHAPVWQGVGPHEAKVYQLLHQGKTRLTFPHLRTDQLSETSRDFDTK